MKNVEIDKLTEKEKDKIFTEYLEYIEKFLDDETCIYDLIEKNLSKIPTIYLVPLYLYFYKNLSLDDIGFLLGYSKQNAYKLIKKGLNILKEFVKQSG